MKPITSRNVINILINTLDKMDSRLISHGERVAFLMMQMLRAEGFSYTPEEIRNLSIVSLLHDIGAYEKSELDDLVTYEYSRKERLPHSAYGSVFIKYFTPFPELAQVIQFHHTNIRRLQNQHLEARIEQAVFCLQLADNVDLYILSHSADSVISYLEQQINVMFPRSVFELFLKAERELHVLKDCIDRPCYHEALLTMADNLPFASDELDSLLNTVIRSIDFRSRHTVFHCATMLQISIRMGELFDLNETDRTGVKYGALLHDLGKSAIPVKILESPDRLLGEDWEIMKSHVVLTEEIIKGNVDDTILEIAIRHHEKLDGTGYTRGLTHKDLTLCQRIVAVADITSALLGVRSYKDAFTKEKVLQILKEMVSSGQICAAVVQMLEEHYNSIYIEIQDIIEKTVTVYEKLEAEFKLVLSLNRA